MKKIRIIKVLPDALQDPDMMFEMDDLDASDPVIVKPRRLERMDVQRALSVLRADVAPTNIRAAAAAADDEKKANDLEQLAFDLERHPHDTVPAFKAAWILLPREDAFRTACAALACMFGAPTHPSTDAPYTALLRESGALGAVLYAVSRYSAFWSCSCAPDGKLLEELEGALTAGVIEECRRTVQAKTSLK